MLDYPVTGGLGTIAGLVADLRAHQKLAWVSVLAPVLWRSLSPVG
jgi:hypothetical protein